MKTKVISLLAIGLFLACNQPKQGPNMIVEGYEVYAIPNSNIQRVVKNTIPAKSSRPAIWKVGKNMVCGLPSTNGMAASRL